MDGKEIYDNASKRDYTDSELDQYAQTLQTIYFHCFASGQLKDFFDILEKAEKENKKLSIPDDIDEYSIDSISLI